MPPNIDQKPTQASRNNTATQLLALYTAFNALLAKLDADGGVTGTDFVSTLAVTAPKLNP